MWNEFDRRREISDFFPAKRQPCCHGSRAAGGYKQICEEEICYEKGRQTCRRKVSQQTDAGAEMMEERMKIEN